MSLKYLTITQDGRCIEIDVILGAGGFYDRSIALMSCFSAIAALYFRMLSLLE